jgi:predicted  nucleic acid-binding Zn-ribbon protein
MFNALRYIQKLEAVGVSREQAETHAEFVMNAIQDEVATKSDLNGIKVEFANLRTEFSELRSDFSNLRSQFAELRSETRQEFANVRAEMRQGFADVRTEMAQMENRIMLRLGSLMIMCMTLQTGILGFFISMKLK